jgi:hypothetical protein
MEPISLIVAALVAGAVASVKDVAAEAVKDAYQGLKTLIKDRYKKVNVETLENNPEDEARQKIIQEDLTAANVTSDPELLEKAQTVLDEVKKNDPETANSVYLNLRGAKVKILDVGGMTATDGSTVTLDAEKIESDQIKIGGMSAGGANKGK